MIKEWKGKQFYLEKKGSIRIGCCLHFYARKELVLFIKKKTFSPPPKDLSANISIRSAREETATSVTALEKRTKRKGEQTDGGVTS